MDKVTMRELRTSGGEVLVRVENGEALTVTRDGRTVGRLVPVPRPRLTRGALLTRWHGVPAVDPIAFRVDVDDLLDPDL